MSEFFTAHPANVSADKRVRIQNWLFSTGADFLTKTVDVEGEPTVVPIENASEVTAEHLEKYAEENVNSNVYNFERQNNMNAFDTAYVKPLS